MSEARQSPDRRRTHGRRLTDRQTSVLELVSLGLENKEIGHRLGISEQAVKEHVSNLLRILAAPNRAALADAAATLRVVGSTDVSSEWLGLVFLHAPMLAALHEGPDHRFVAANEAYRKAAGPRELIGRAFREAFPDFDEAGIVKFLDEAYRTGQPVTVRDVPARWYRGVNGALDLGYLTILIQPMRRADGTIGGLAQFSMDVTAEVDARNAAKQLDDEQIAILDQLPCGVIVVDRDGYVIKMNDWGRRMVPWDGAAKTRPSKLLELRDLKTGGDLSENARPLMRALRGERFPEKDCLGVVVSSGERIPLRTSAAPLFDGTGAVRGAVAIFSRISGD
jgi:DNA-binding CsgD family transcriptional regulator